MSTLYVNNISSETGTTITIPTGKKLIVTDAGGFTAPGSVIQVVSANKTDTASTSSTSFGDIAGLSATITPRSATSKILVLSNLNGIVSSTGNNVSFNLLRDSTAVAQPDGSGTNKASFNHYASNTGSTGGVANFLDSPSTTSATTYKFQWKVDAGSAYLNRHVSGTNFNSISTITLMEISA